MTAIPLDEQLRQLADAVVATHPDDAADLREHAARIAEAWEDPDAVGGLEAAMWTVSDHAVKVKAILGRYERQEATHA